ncbi:hypothetical protein BDZ85DRAFT_285411 [Elsinoe ampelina]|uniref:Uncharacterized protein n=1 Tax=Elsinoe ampelina TaxID=302913 RepID=A0A6A6G1H7_9PEZI|nr:hypothetical protein BDZ85DRAFT_285411 [Elsinoe ampelina]
MPSERAIILSPTSPSNVASSSNVSSSGATTSSSTASDNETQQNNNIRQNSNPTRLTVALRRARRLKAELDNHVDELAAMEREDSEFRAIAAKNAAENNLLWGANARLGKEMENMTDLAARYALQMTALRGEGDAFRAERDTARAEREETERQHAKMRVELDKMGWMDTIE